MWQKLAAFGPVRVGAVILLVIVALGAAAPLIAPHEPYRMNPRMAYSPPSREYPFGADQIGRCVLSRTLYGTRVSVSVTLASLLIALCIGIPVGLLSGYYKKLDYVIMRIIDVVMAFPGMMIAIAIVATLGPGMWNVTIAVGISNSPQFARLIRGAVLSLRESDFVKAAIASGSSDLRIMFRHILVNVIPSFIVFATVQTGWILLTISSLGFLGLGAQPPTPEWGALVSEGRIYLQRAPHMAIMPSLFIFATVLALNLLGDGMRDVLDPRLKNS